MAPRSTASSTIAERRPQAGAHAEAMPASKLAFNADLAAIAIALALAALIRWNVLPRIGW